MISFSNRMAQHPYLGREAKATKSVPPSLPLPSFVWPEVKGKWRELPGNEVSRMKCVIPVLLGISDLSNQIHQESWISYVTCPNLPLLYSILCVELSPPFVTFFVSPRRRRRTLFPWLWQTHKTLFFLSFLRLPLSVGAILYYGHRWDLGLGSVIASN